MAPTVRRDPPGPQTPFSVQEVQENALHFVLDLTREYGDIVRYRVGSWTTTLLNRPEYVEHILKANHLNYRKQGTPDLMMLKPMLGEGLLTSDGETWTRHRRLAQPSFHRHRIEKLGRLMTDNTLETLERWREIAVGNETVELTDEMTQLTTRILADSLFGVDIRSLVESFSEAVQTMNEFMGNFDPSDARGYLLFQNARATIDNIVDHILDEYRKSERDTDDYLSMLLEARDGDSGEPLSHQELRDQVLTILMAGHETTAKALTWTFYLLDRHPREAERLRSELEEVLATRVPTVEDLPRLPTGWMVLQEAMRLYPPVWTISRLVVQEDEIDGFRIPAGSLVLVSPFAIHRHPELWENPTSFTPRRFQLPDFERRSTYSYLPFSAGPRQCLGKSFATVELQLVLATIVQRFDLRVVPGHMVEPEALVTLRPRYGLPVTLHPLAD